MTTQALTADQAARLLAATSDPRAAVLVRLLMLEGFGLAEVLALDHEHITGPRGSMSAAMVRHGRVQPITLDVDTASAVQALRRTTPPSGPLLLGEQPDGSQRRISRFGADLLIKQAAAAAGLDVPVSSNVLRRSYAVAAHRAGEHILDTRDRMGHRDVRTTTRHLGGELNPST